MAKKQVKSASRCIRCGGTAVARQASYKARAFRLTLKGDTCVPCNKAILTAAGDAALRVVKAK